MVAVAREASDPYEDALAQQLAARIGQLANNALLVAPSDGNTPLRAAADAVQVSTLDVSDTTTVFEAMLKVTPERPNPWRGSP